jgi:hypothetical protein
MKRTHSPTLIGIIGIFGLIILLTFPAERIHSAIPTIIVPGPYPYETPVRVPAPAQTAESTVLPTPAPFPYAESSPSISDVHDRDSRTVTARRPLTPKAVREAAFKYNGVPDFCEFLAALPASVSVFDPKVGRTRTLVQGGRVLRQNVAWLRKHQHAHPKPNDRAVVSVEDLGTQNSGI